MGPPASAFSVTEDDKDRYPALGCRRLRGCTGASIRCRERYKSMETPASAIHHTQVLRSNLMMMDQSRSERARKEAANGR